MTHAYDYISSMENVLIDGKAPNFMIKDKVRHLSKKIFLVFLEYPMIYLSF